MDIPFGDIKKDGEAGLAYAYDSENVYTSASNAINGKEYTCPICGCPMHVTTTKKGRRIFARNPNQVHTNPACITIEHKKIERSFEDLDPEIFITSLCYVAARKKNTDKISVDDSINSTEPKSPAQPDEEPKITKFSSLKQIAESGIEHLKADDMQGNHKISDFIMTYKYAKDFFTNPQFKLKARIVYARFLFAESRDSSLIFSLYDRKNDFSVKFRLVFLKNTEFKKYRDKFGAFKPDASGRTKFIKHYDTQNVLIACDKWLYIEKNRCNNFCPPKDSICSSCSGMYQATFTNSKQLYLLPPDH